MSLIDLYIAEVGSRLPLRGRGDIEKELRSTLEDMLEDRSQKAGRPVDDAMMSDLLKEYGPPDKVAATYQPVQYLIGPRIYPFFLFVLRIALSALVIVLSIGLGIQLGQQSLQGLELARAMGRGLMGILSAALQAFGNMVLVFAILERVMPSSEFRLDEDKKAWDPAALQKTEGLREVRLWSTLAGVLFTTALLVVFNGYPQLIGLYFLKGGVWTALPLLSEAFFRWLPYLNILWALQIVLSLAVLRQGRWQTWSRWAGLALNVAGIVIAYALLSGPSIISVSPASLQATGLANAEAAGTLAAILQQAARGAIALVMLLQGVDVVKEVIRLVVRRR